MLQQVIQRKKYYEDLGKENNFVLDELKIYKHREIPNTYFIHAKYTIGEGGIYKEDEVFEVLNEQNDDWEDIRNTFNKLEYGAFLGDCEVCNF